MITNSQRKLTPLLDAAINESIKLINQYIPPDRGYYIKLYKNRLINIFKQAGYIYNRVIEDMIVAKIKFADAKIDHQKIIENMIADDPYAPYYITTHPVDVPNHITYIYQGRVYISKIPLTQSDLHILDQLPGTATGIITVELANIISQKYKNYHPIGDFNTIVLQSIVDIIISMPKPADIYTSYRIKSHLVNHYLPDYCYFMKNFIYISDHPISYVELKRQYNMFQLDHLLNSQSFIEYDTDIDIIYNYFKDRYETFIQNNKVYILSAGLSALFDYIEKSNFINLTIENFTNDEQRVFLLKYSIISHIEFIDETYYKFVKYT